MEPDKSYDREFGPEDENQFVLDLVSAFDDVKMYEQGKKKLKTARELLNELR
jgi:hypothetical protein